MPALARPRVRKGKAYRGEAQALSVGVAAAVAGIAQDGMSGRFRVAPNLMMSPRRHADFKTRPIGPGLKNTPGSA